MKIALKIIISIAVLVCWQVFTGDLWLACILGAFVFIVLVANPKKEQSFEEGDEYKAMVKEKNERKLFLEEERLLEKHQAAEKQQQSKIKNQKD